VKIATFNINNINKRLGNLLRWLEREKPEVVCLQELRTEQRCFPADALRSTGCSSVRITQRVPGQPSGAKMAPKKGVRETQQQPSGLEYEALVRRRR
jgi:exonuclease III